MVKEKKEKKLIWCKRLKKDLENIRENYMMKEQSRIMIITGRIGIGKSTLGMQICKYIDPTFCLSRICFEPDSFRKALKDNRQKAILYDEAITGFYAKDFFTKLNRQLSKAMTMSRKYSNFICLAIPKLERIDKEVREDLVSEWIDIKIDRNKRRYMEYRSHKRLVQHLKYGYSRPNYIYTFPKYNVFGKKYDRLKDKSIERFFKQLEERKNILSDIGVRNEVIKAVHQLGKFKQEEIGAMFGLSRQAVWEIMRVKG